MAFKVRILGCAADGLVDCLSIDGASGGHDLGFYLKDVVLPTHPGNPLIAGVEAEKSRVSSGLYWPPEARVGPDTPLRRVPVSCAWRMLIDAGDKPCRWSNAPGVSTPVSRILASHIVTSLGDRAKAPCELVISIPNDLGEFGQDALIRETERLGESRNLKIESVRLVWRPIAAALSWLEEVQRELSERKLEENDFILVIHLGPDSFEIVPLRLRKREHNGRTYVIPLREPPTEPIPIAGSDWGASLAQSAVGSADSGAFWQAFTQFPEVWESLAQKSWNDESLPRAWSRKVGWTLWEPDKAMFSGCENLSAVPSEALRGLVCSESDEIPDFKFQGTWTELIEEQILKGLETYKGKLQGVILSGPLDSSISSSWYKGMRSAFRNKGVEGHSDEPKVGTVWMTTNSDVISKGALIYGQRLAASVPTYLDTLQELSLLAGVQQSQHKWKSLVDAKECPGGEIYTNSVKGFSLKRRAKELLCYLRKGESKVFKKTSIPFPYAPKERVPLTIKVEMSPASGLAKVKFVPLNNDFLRGEPPVSIDYSKMEETTELP